MATIPDLTPLLAQAAAARPDGVALVHGDTALTWAELEHEVQRFATGLAEHGIVAGHRVMLCAGNRLEFVVAYLGTLRVQAVAVPVNPRSTEHELVRMLADSGSRLLVADEPRLEVARASISRVHRALRGDPDPRDLEIGEALFADLLARTQPVRLVAVGADAADGELAWRDLMVQTPQPAAVVHDEEKLAALLYTSGSSGRPRAAMLTHRALRSNIEQVAAVEPAMMQAGDVVLGVLPLFHVYGLNAVLGGALRHTATLVLVDHFDPLEVLELIERHQVSVVPVAPPVFTRWLALSDLRERLSSVRLVLSGSAPLPPATSDRFTELTGIPVHQGYGLTEASPVVTSTLASPSEERVPGSVGATLPGVELQLVDEHSGQPEGEDPGEIRIRGANLFSGYWPDGADGPDADGWWNTGDVGFLQGPDLVLVDRVRDLIIVSGFNVYPVEVEEVIGELAGVAQVAVVGAPAEGSAEGKGEEVIAYLVPVPGQNTETLVEAVRAHCAERLARFKQPHRIEVVDTLPRTVTGKIQKGRLRGIERRRALGILE